MSIDRTQIESWNPSALAEMGHAWLVMGERIEDLFDRYKSAVANVDGGHWQGVAADAALARAVSDHRAAVRLVDHLDRVAKIAIEGFHQVDAPLQQARIAIAGAEHAGFTVSEDLTVSKPDIAALETSMATIEELRALQQWQHAITEAATATENADNDVKHELSAARADLQVAFISPATLGPDQARGDAAQLLDDPSGLTPEAEQRLIDAGSLTSAQLTALQSGAPVTIPAAQMEYLNALARSLDGKSPQAIETMMEKLPPDARQGMANALQLVSTPNVTASVRGDSQIPTNGAVNLLPRQMYQSLTSKDLTMESDRPYHHGYHAPFIYLNGVADNQANAGIAAMSSPALRHGTGLDTGVFNAAATYLHAQVIAQHNPDDYFVVDGLNDRDRTGPLTEPMFRAVADDKAVVSAEVAGPHGQAFLSDVFNAEWSDHGKSISQLFQISAQDAVGTPGNRPSEVRATESGQIAWSIAQYMSDHHTQLLDLPGDPGTAVGQRNSTLMINLANDLAPYYSTFAGSESIRGVGHFTTTSQLAAMYSVLASNPTAGVEAAVATLAQENAMAVAYGAGGPSTYAQIAGQMQHALQTGTASAETALNEGDAYRASWRQAVKGAEYDTAYKAAAAVLSFVPGGGPTIKIITNLLNVGGPAAKPSLEGITDPSTVDNPINSIPNTHASNQLNTDTMVQEIFDGVVSRDPSIVNDPALVKYRHTDAHGNPSITVKGLGAQQTIIDVLGSRYGMNFVQNWEQQFELGMLGGKLPTAR